MTVRLTQTGYTGATHAAQARANNQDRLKTILLKDPIFLLKHYFKES